LRPSRVVFTLAFAAFFLTLARPASAQCAPYGPYYMSGFSWYTLLNNDSFSGSTCSPNWVGANVINSSLCTDFYGTPYKAALLSTSSSSFTQHFTVPNTPGTMDVSLLFATSGTPSWWDRIIVEIWEAGVLKESISVRTDLGPFYCHREDFSFTGNYAGKSLDIRVRAQIVTSGVSYDLDWVTLFYNV